MKKLLFSLLLINISSNSYSQALITPIVDNKIEKPTDWTSYLSVNNLEIDYKYVECDPSVGFDNESVVFRFTNLSSKKLQLNWHLDLYYDNTCRTCDHLEEYSYEFYLSPDEAIEGNCESQGGYILKLFSKFIDASYSKGGKLTAFKLDNMIVTELE